MADRDTAYGGDIEDIYVEGEIDVPDPDPDQRLWLGGYDFTGVMNALGPELMFEAHDQTTFDDATRRPER